MNQEIRNYNSESQWHGYQERYSAMRRTLTVRGTFKNNEQIGYIEWHVQLIKETLYAIR